LAAIPTRQFYINWDYFHNFMMRTLLFLFSRVFGDDISPIPKSVLNISVGNSVFYITLLVLSGISHLVSSPRPARAFFMIFFLLHGFASPFFQSVFGFFLAKGGAPLTVDPYHAIFHGI